MTTEPITAQEIRSRALRERLLKLLEAGLEAGAESLRGEETCPACEGPLTYDASYFDEEDPYSDGYSGYAGTATCSVCLLTIRFGASNKTGTLSWFSWDEQERTREVRVRLPVPLAEAADNHGVTWVWTPEHPAVCLLLSGSEKTQDPQRLQLALAAALAVLCAKVNHHEILST